MKVILLVTFFVLNFCGINGYNSLVGDEFLFAVPRLWDCNYVAFLTIFNTDAGDTDVEIVSQCFNQHMTIPRSAQAKVVLSNSCMVMCSTEQSTVPPIGFVAEKLGVRITTSNGVQVVLGTYYSGGQLGSDSLTVYPVNYLGDNYRLGTYQSVPYYYNVLTIAAASDDTSLTIYDANGTLLSTYALNAMETYSYAAKIDISGYEVIASKNIAVISGLNQDGYFGSVWEMMPPASALGTSYQMADINGDLLKVVRVIANSNNTNVRVDDAYLISLNAGDVQDIVLKANQLSTLTTSQPVLVLRITAFFNAESLAGFSDYVVPQISSDNITVAVGILDMSFWCGSATNYAVIMIDSSRTNTLLINNNATAASWSSSPAHNVATATINLNELPANNFLITCTYCSVAVYGISAGCIHAQRSGNYAYVGSAVPMPSNAMLTTEQTDSPALSTCAPSQSSNASKVCNNRGLLACQCYQGYTGSDCETEINFCEHVVQEWSSGNVTFGDICKEHGTCLSTPSGASCACNAGFTGQFCEQAISNEVLIARRCMYNVPQQVGSWNNSTACDAGFECVPDNPQCYYAQCTNRNGWCIPIDPDMQQQAQSYFKALVTLKQRR